MIIGLQQQQTEVGRIRLGVKVASSNGMRPAKLDTLRFTSPRRELIERVAELYGGKAETWQPPKGNSQWQVITTATQVPVMVPPQDPAESQWLEMWSKGGCLRRCDGRTERISGKPCMCDPDPQERDCKMHTRVNVLLEEVPGIGVWRVDTGSFYAATELPTTARILAEAKGLIPGKLILDQRTVTRGGKTFNFAVPVLDIAEFTPAELLSGKVPEMAAARRAEAIDNQSRVAIAAGPDYSSLLLAVTTREAFEDLWTEAGNAGALTDELREEFKAKAAELRDEPVDAEIVEDDRA